MVPDFRVLGAKATRLAAKLGPSWLAQESVIRASQTPTPLCEAGKDVPNNLKQVFVANGRLDIR